VDAPPIPWHEFTNIGETMVQVLLVEKKYQAASPLSQSVCPKADEHDGRESRRVPHFTEWVT
jgi:hypothetical protein